MMSLITKYFVISLSFYLTIANAKAANQANALDELPVEARQAVIKWNFKFKPFSETDFSSEIVELFDGDKKRVAPMKTVGDYNGDGIDDYALLGEAEKQQYLIAVLSGKAPSVVVVEKWSDPNFKTNKVDGIKSTAASIPVYLAKADGSLPLSYSKQTKRQAIQLEAFLGAVQLFKIENGKASELKP